MPAKKPGLNPRQELRAEFMSILLQRGVKATIQTAMLQASAIVQFVEEGKIAGLFPGDDTFESPSSRSPGRSSAQT